jgi:hypothetical protein
MWGNVTFNDRDYAFLATMDEVLLMTLEYLEKASLSQDAVMLGAYLKMASRSMRCALEIYGDHLAQNCVEMKQGEAR